MMIRRFTGDDGKLTELFKPKPEETLTEHRKALAIFQKLANAKPTVTDLQTDPAWRQDFHERFLFAVPKVAELQIAMAWTHYLIGDCLSQTRQSEEALTEYRKALAIFQKLAHDYPAVTDFQSGLSSTSLKLAAHQAWFGRAKELAATLERMRVVAKDTQEATTAERAAKACSILPSTSKAELEVTLALARKGVELDKSGYLRDWRLLALGMAEYRSGHYAAANEALVAAAKAGPNNPWVPGIAAFYRAMSLFRQGKEASYSCALLHAVAAD
jgi:tetratricopeptide (TPR) repeat protein